MILNDILGMALKSNTSDVHLKAGLPPIFRIDGSLRPLPKAPRMTADMIHEMCDAIMNDRQRARFEDTHEVDLAYGVPGLGRFRVNVFSQRGTMSAVFRAIPYKILTLDDLELPEILKKIALVPRGLVLVTGPTGSGKSTTLASIIDHINAERQEHIVTIEDPIEYLHPHKKCIVNQREVGSDTFSFKNALKYILRQDPDVVMVGEIRDADTGKIATQAALTGHLVVSTLHTNDAAATVTRLKDMGIQTFMICATVEAILAQRLVRRCCSQCREEVEASDDMLVDLGLKRENLKGKKFYRGRGCELCNNTGYKGRVGLFELMLLNDELREELGLIQ